MRISVNKFGLVHNVLLSPCSIILYRNLQYLESNLKKEKFGYCLLRFYNT